MRDALGQSERGLHRQLKRQNYGKGGMVQA